MYDFTGGPYLDNLGRIYYPNAGDSIVIKSVFANKGFSAFSGSAFDFNYNLGGGSNPLPVDTTLEFRMSNWGEPNTGSWTTFTTNADLETARATLTGFSSSVGIDIQFRITGTTAVAGRYVIGLKFPVTIDASYNPPVYYTPIGISGAQVGTLLAGYDNSVPAAPVLRGSNTLSGSAGVVQMPYDYDAVPVAYRLVARKPGYSWVDLIGAYTSSAINIPVSMVALSWYTAGVSGVAFDHVAHTITITLPLSPIQVASTYQDNLSQLANMAVSEFLTCDGIAFSTTYTVMLSGAGVIIGSYTDAAGLHVHDTSSALIPGTLVQLWDIAAGTQLYLGTPAGAMDVAAIYTGNRTLRMRAMYCSGVSATLFVEQLGVRSSSGTSFLVTQQPDLVYAANGIDGSTVTGVSIIDSIMRINVTAGDVAYINGVEVRTLSWKRLYAYNVMWLATPAGIVDDGVIMTASDPSNYKITGFTIRNSTGYPLVLTDGYGVSSITGSPADIIDYTSPHPIFSAPRAVYAYGQSAATPAEIWSHASRTLTADPGAAGHAATLAAALDARDQAALAVALSA